MGEAFTRHSLRPLHFQEGRTDCTSGATRRENETPCFVLFEM